MQDNIYEILFYYDEAGNRIRKAEWHYTGYEQEPIFIRGGDNPSWELVLNEFYVRDVSGKELAIYDGTTLQQWNVWGIDNVGKIESGNRRYFYLKDHLGSIRAVVSESNSVVSASDYDCWGYLMDGRTYQSDNNKYKYTGKERDAETNYDYFGARYYDSRIANWTSIDPLFEKHFDYSPYNYVLRNPIRLIDPEGKQVQVIGGLVLETLVEVAAYGIIIYSGYKIYENLSEYQKTDPIISQESVQITQDANVATQTYERSRSKVKKDKIEGAIEQIQEHLENIGGKNPKYPNPSDQDKKDWLKHIEKHIKNIKKEALKLKKNPGDVVKELIQKGKLDE